VNEHGEFSANLVLSGVRFFFCPAVRRQLEAEIRAQFAAFCATGLPLDHANAHNHMQLHPTVGALIMKVGRDYGLKAMRVPYEPLLCSWRASRDGLGQRLGSWLLLGSWAWVMTNGVRRANIAFNDYLFGIQDTGQMTADRVLALIARLPDGVSEIYFHPAVRKSPETAWPEHYACEDELAALTSPAVAAALQASDIQRVSYSDLVAR
jgi:hopanoid biosynthesis associated protein HpnK